MRTINPSLALASLVGLLAAASCTLITDIDRTKIPPPGAEGGAPGTGGTGGTMGEAGGGTGGSKGGTGGSGGTGATGGSGMVTPECKHAEGNITLVPVTYLSDKDTITIGDGIHPKVVFEFDLLPGDGVASGHQKILFNGHEDNFGLASLITDAINDPGIDLAVTATMASADVSGAAGAAGASGASAGGAAGQTSSGGQAGEGTPPTGDAVISLTNDYAGALGNVTIRDTVGNPNLTTKGMSGGNAVACAEDTICTSGDECASGDCGTDSICVQ